MNATTNLPASVLTKKQVKKKGPVYFAKDGEQYRITATIRYDDSCGNGHNSFAITAQIDIRGHDFWRDDCGGMCHDDIAKHFPELAPLLKWHLCSSDGPLHYVANTVYHAGDGDKGKQRCDRAGKPMWQLGYLPGRIDLVCQTEKPESITLHYFPVLEDGKDRDLAAARDCAIWPEATDAQLLAPKEELTAALLARLPGLMAEFKSAVESLGLVY
jgi:hypothetical protein